MSTFGYPPDSVPVPCVYVEGYEIDYQSGQVMLGADGQSITYTMCLLVSRADDLSGHALLDSINSSGAVRDALYADDTLEGLLSDLYLMNIRTDAYKEVAGTFYLSAEITVQAVG
jgi:hypothetical protein